MMTTPQKMAALTVDAVGIAQEVAGDYGSSSLVSVLQEPTWSRVILRVDYHLTGGPDLADQVVAILGL